jgi:hypothetical protein
MWDSEILGVYLFFTLFALPVILNFFVMVECVPILGGTGLVAYFLTLFVFGPAANPDSLTVVAISGWSVSTGLGFIGIVVRVIRAWRFRQRSRRTTNIPKYLH